MKRKRRKMNNWILKRRQGSLTFNPIIHYSFFLIEKNIAYQNFEENINFTRVKNNFGVPGNGPYFLPHELIFKFLFYKNKSHCKHKGDQNEYGVQEYQKTFLTN